MNNKIKNKKRRKMKNGMALLSFFTLLFIFSCSKDYYKDTGLQVGQYPYSSLELLAQDTFYFDTVVAVIQLAGMEDVINDSLVTFFSPTDHSVAKSMDALNQARDENFEDSLRLEDVPEEVWRNVLSQYIFRGKYMLKDIARRSPSELDIYPGMNMESWNSYIMNIGVEYSDYQGTKDVGPRRLTITNVGNLANPKGQTSNVATSDMQTENGVIHVLDDSHSFGFSTSDFVELAERFLN